jgi:hypothetical protein
VEEAIADQRKLAGRIVEGDQLAVEDEIFRQPLELGE